jgi:hypothetical protein
MIARRETKLIIDIVSLLPTLFPMLRIRVSEFQGRLRTFTMIITHIFANEST